MAENSFSVEEVVMFDEMIVAFNDNNITAHQVDKFKMPELTGARTGFGTTQTISRPLKYRGISKEGKTLVDADFTTRTQLSVPSSLNYNDSAPSDLISEAFTMNAVELNDPLQRDRIVQGAVQKLSSEMDVRMANEIALKGSIVVAETVSITKYSQPAQCEALMTIRGVPLMDERTIILNATDNNGIADDLQGRGAPPTGVSLTAFERSKIPRIATFDSFKANFMPSLAATTASAYAVDGDQKFIPRATDANGQNVDNRTMLLTVKTGTGGAAGDAFTIAGVNVIGKINKVNTLQLQTFRIIAVNSATEWEITPPIITDQVAPVTAERQYANCSDQAADDAAISFLNSQDSITNIFFVNEAVEIVHGSLAMVDMNAGGVSSLRKATDSGIELVLLKQSSILDLSTKYRVSMWARGNILEPEMCGILIGGQT